MTPTAIAMIAGYRTQSGMLGRSEDVPAGLERLTWKADEPLKVRMLVEDEYAKDSEAPSSDTAVGIKFSSFGM